MRVFARLAVLGILVVSCRDNIIGPVYETEYEPYVCEPVALDTMFGVYQDSLRMVIGAAESFWFDWGTYDGCTYQQLPAADLTWTIRDSSVVRDSVPDWAEDGRPRYVMPKTPGQTVMAVETTGYADSIFVTVPDTVAMGPVVAVDAGASVSCAITDDRTVWCWGGGGRGILGDWDDPALGSCMGSLCSPMPIAVASGAESVAVQSEHACMLDVAGAASCWGANYSFQLGSMTPEFSSMPVPVSGGHVFSSLSAGWQHTCGVTTDNAGYCWGDAYSGKLGGDHREGPSATPVNVDEDLRWVSLDASQISTCGVSDEGHLYCWGVLGASNETGPPGSERCQFFTGKDGSSSSLPCAYSPIRVPLVSPLGADTLFVQASGQCALTTTGSVYCYDGDDGAYRALPGHGSFTSLTSGTSHTCGIRAAGTAACWGDNWMGQLGDGTAFYHGDPVAVSGGYIWDQIVAGGEHTCGLMMQEAWCWGSTRVGQAGTSILEPQLTPAKAHGQD